MMASPLPAHRSVFRMAPACPAIRPRLPALARRLFDEPGVRRRMGWANARLAELRRQGVTEQPPRR